MTDQNPSVDVREVALDAATAHNAASAEMEAFLRRVPDVPGLADMAEYANLLAHEEQLRRQRRASAEAMGLRIESFESQ
ncbi:hypothetical protein [Melissospora conviva]|uniref:hypothetical protein n=1 Tax=Melissospora conviva TaxID=3388432 RepID=UPI003B77FD8B